MQIYVSNHMTSRLLLPRIRIVKLIFKLVESGKSRLRFTAVVVAFGFFNSKTLTHNGAIQSVAKFRDPIVKH